MYASTVAAVDTAFIYIMAFAFLLFALVIFLMLYFVFRYRRSRNPVAQETRDTPLLEIGWIAAALLLVISMFFAGLSGFTFLKRPPSGSMRVTVIARQWSWLFRYENGRTSDTLVVPQGKPVALALISQDVIHGFYVPDFRIKQDVVPGMTTRAWFQSDALGAHDVLCTQYCGLEHSRMLSSVVVVPPADFTKWYAGEEVEIEGVVSLTETPEGEALLRQKGCLDCHSLDGSKRIGPSLKGLYESTVEVFTSGKRRSIAADEEYCTRSILDPGADVVEGYKDMMPTGTGKYTDAELHEMVEFLKTLK